MNKNRITDRQLKKLNELQKNSTNIVFSLGSLEADYETRKNELMGNLFENNKKFKEFESEIFEDYGKVNIDQQTGEITEIIEEENRRVENRVEENRREENRREENRREENIKED